jgi:hypothetical protein
MTLEMKIVKKYLKLTIIETFALALTQLVCDLDIGYSAKVLLVIFKIKKVGTV